MSMENNPRNDDDTLWEIPAPEKRMRILSDILKNGKAISDMDNRIFSQDATAYLRVELTGVVGYLRMLSNGDLGKLPVEQKEITDNLLQTSQRLIVIVNNLIKLGKLQKTPTLHKGSEANKVKITHFEDDTFLGGMYATKFSMLGFEYHLHESPGKDPIKIILKDKPDLIIMDIIMPNMDGFTATKLLKSDHRTKSIPILGLCNLGQAADIQKAREVGMSDYMVTANHMPQEVVDRVKQILGLSAPKWWKRIFS